MVEVFNTKCCQKEDENNPQSYFCLSPKYEESNNYEDKKTDDTESAIFIIATVL